MIGLLASNIDKMHWKIIWKQMYVYNIFSGVPEKYFWGGGGLQFKKLKNAK